MTPISDYCTKLKTVFLAEEVKNIISMGSNY